MASSNHLCYVVDDEDIVIRNIERSKLDATMRWRNTGIYLFNQSGEVLLARRHPSKKVHPNCWGPSATGTVEAGENYETNIVKEIEEELGIIAREIVFHGAFRIEHGSAKRFTGMFSGTWDGEISQLTLENEEVSEAKWMSTPDLKAALAIHPENFVPGIIKTLPAIGIELSGTSNFKSAKNKNGETYYY